MSTKTTSASSANAPPRVIGRQLAVGFGLIAVIAAGMCVMLLGTIRQVGGVVETMRGDEAAIRRGGKLSAAAREQYMHMAHSLLEGDTSHLEHYEAWKDRLADDAHVLSQGASNDVRLRLDRVEQLSTEMDRIFYEVLLPAAQKDNLVAVRAERRHVEDLSLEAASEADAVAIAGERRMARAHDDARRAGVRGLAVGFLCVTAVVLVAVAYTFRLRAAVLRPLAALARAAGRFGRGDFEHRVGEVGRGELGELARAFDRMAEELAEREKEILTRERMAGIGRLAAGVAHEINNPIGIIRGYVKTMLPEASSAHLREELEVLDEEAAACQRLTGDLLAYAEKPRLNARPVAMDAFLEDAGVRLREVAKPNEATLVVEAGEGTVEADPGRLRQVLANLVRNATQASPPGAPVRISGRPRSAGGYGFSVADAGPGVDSEDQARIFEPFVSKRSGGSGLGLSVCRSIVTAHGGTIWVEPSEDGGARFCVELPPHPPKPEEQAPA